MWMSARRLAVMAGVVRGAVGTTQRASARGVHLAVEGERLVQLGGELLAHLGRRVLKRAGDHVRGLLVVQVALRLLVEGDSGTMANQLVRQGARDATYAEGEDDVLDRRAVARLDHPSDQVLLLLGSDLPGRRAVEDVVGLELAVARPA